MTRLERKQLWERVKDNGWISDCTFPPELTKAEAAQVLVWFNRYRRGCCDRYPHPRAIGIAIEMAIDSLEGFL